MPTYGYGRPGADGILAFSQTDFTDDPATHADVINADLLAFVRS
jgi:hypothetical protein